MLGAVLSLSAGVAGTTLAYRRFPSFRSRDLVVLETLISIYPTFLGAFYGAEHASYSFKSPEYPGRFGYVDQEARMIKEAERQEPEPDQAERWLLRHRYPIIGATWLTIMAISLRRMRRPHYLYPGQKLVQARVIAQAVTVTMLLVTAALEIRQISKEKGKYEKVEVFDPNNPAHKDVLVTVSPNLSKISEQVCICRRTRLLPLY